VLLPIATASGVIQKAVPAHIGIAQAGQTERNNPVYKHRLLLFSMVKNNIGLSLHKSEIFH